jgi:MFS transporter, Spinster family, sphingosine-1-phosphate transporter
VLSPTIIDDITPPEKKGRTLAIFFAAAPIGGAAGYLMGGTVATHWGWREALFVAGGPGLILAAVFMFVVEPTRKLVTEKINVWKNVALLWKIPMFRVAVIGYCAHTAAVGAFGHWGPTFLVREFPDSLNLKAANTNFGGTLVVGGLIATVLGGWWSDKIQRRFPSVNSSTPYAAASLRYQRRCRWRNLFCVFCIGDTSDVFRHRIFGHYRSFCFNNSNQCDFAAQRSH